MEENSVSRLCTASPMAEKSGNELKKPKKEKFAKSLRNKEKSPNCTGRRKTVANGTTVQNPIGQPPTYPVFGVEDFAACTENQMQANERIMAQIGEKPGNLQQRLILQDSFRGMRHSLAVQADASDARVNTESLESYNAFLQANTHILADSQLLDHELFIFDDGTIAAQGDEWEMIFHGINEVEWALNTPGTHPSKRSSAATATGKMLEAMREARPKVGNTNEIA